MKLKELKADFHAFSKAASDVSRQLSLAGIAIVWILKSNDKEGTEYIANLDRALISTLQFFLFSLAMDLLHAFIPSIIYGIRVEKEDLKKTSEETELDFSFSWVIPAWILYILKIISMILGYIWLIDYMHSLKH
jgi:hypothetical protein